jgi:hypothetical protein
VSAYGDEGDYYEPTLPSAQRRRPAPVARGRVPGWAWILAVFALFSLALLVCGGIALYAFGQRPALLPPGATPTIMLLTRPAPTQTLTPPLPTPGPSPTPTGLPTATLPPPPPGSLAIGDRVQVVNTGGVGLSLREGPGTEFPRVAIAIEGELLEVIDGPRAIAGFTWWRLRRDDGVEGWGVQNFLQKAP